MIIFNHFQILVCSSARGYKGSIQKPSKQHPFETLGADHFFDLFEGSTETPSRATHGSLGLRPTLEEEPLHVRFVSVRG